LVSEEVLGPDICEDEAIHNEEFGPGSRFAPEEVNNAFTLLGKEGYLFLRPARAIFWEKDNMNYWIQWTRKDDITFLYAYDPEVDKAVEILQVQNK